MLRIYLSLLGVLLFAISLFPTTPPNSFPTGSIITIQNGEGLFTLAKSLREDNVIRSLFWFLVTATVLGGERNMKAGQYLMSHPQNVFVIAWRVLRGDYDIETVKLTIPEGFKVEEISALFDERFTFFNHADFIAQAPGGYLFPDTYFVQVTATASSTIALLTDNFSHKISTVVKDIESSGRSMGEIIKMASIIESEAKFLEDRKIISGILWKRIKLKIPLQVDSDLDTYKHVGFPPKPISNPGLESINAALHPTTTPYLYFLTGDDGFMHYARTFAEHKINKLKYLKDTQ